MFCLTDCSFLMENSPHVALLHLQIVHSVWKTALFYTLDLPSLFLVCFFLFSLPDSRDFLRNFSFWLMLFPLGIPTVYLPLSFSPWRTPCKKQTVKTTNVVEGLNWTLPLWFYLIFCGFRGRFWYSFITVICGWHNSDEPLIFPALLKTKPTVCCKQRSGFSD